MGQPPPTLVVIAEGKRRERVTAALVRAGRAPVTAVAATAAIDLAAVERSSLVVLDLATPGADVAALHDALRQRLGTEPAVVALAADPDAAVAAIAAGASDAWLVDVAPAELDVRLAAIGRLIAERATIVTLLDNVPDVVMLLDPTGVVLSTSRVRLGDGRRGPVGRRADELLAPAARDAAVDDFRRCVEHREVRTLEARSTGDLIFRCRLVPLVRDDRVEGVIVVASDVTAQRTTEAELAALAAKSAATLRVLPDMVFWLGRDAVFDDFYAPEGALLLAPPDQIVGRPIEATMPAPLAALLRAGLDAAFATRAIQVVEYQVRLDGKTLDYEARFMASAPEQAVAVVRDVTERKRMQTRLAISDRLAALGTLAAGVAHEINNPLTYILIGVESAAKEIKRRVDQPLGERAGVLVQRLEGALEGARRVRRIVSDLKAFARGDDDDGPVDVRAHLDVAIGLVDSQLRYRARLVKDYREVPPVAASGDRLNQVFLNLLINASQALSEARAADNVVRVAVERGDGEAVVVSISDTGHGIPADDLGRIFDPFFTTKPVGVGTGLGLWICHSIVTSVGGHIAVESEVGVGTTVRVTLPEATVAARAAPAAGVEEEAPWRGGRILLIDDEEQVAVALGLMFEGSEIVTAGGGRAGLAQLARDAAFDWILCDLMMPDVSGIDVHAEVRRLWPGLEARMVFVTGGVFTPRASEFLAGVDNPVLHKPFRPGEVGALLRQRSEALRRG